jgi:hypothetical protein
MGIMCELSGLDTVKRTDLGVLQGILAASACAEGKIGAECRDRRERREGVREVQTAQGVLGDMYLGCLEVPAGGGSPLA